MSEIDMLTDAAATAPAKWHPKETAPMDGKWCWASDGTNVWVVIGPKDGTLRSATASSVKFLTRDYIPAQPIPEPPQ